MDGGRESPQGVVRGLRPRVRAGCERGLRPGRGALEVVGAQIPQGLIPEIDDINLRQRLLVKGKYNCLPTDFNAWQISRLDPGQVATLGRVFRRHREILDHFGYDLL